MSKDIFPNGGEEQNNATPPCRLLYNVDAYFVQWVLQTHHTFLGKNQYFCAMT